MRKTTTRRGSTAVLVAAIMLTGTACSAGSADPTGSSDARVATLRSGPPAAPSATKDNRPRERLDDTAADAKARLQPYMKCMLDHGVDVAKERATHETTGDTDAANKACADLLPLPPWELDPTNPEAKSFARDVVACLRKKGVRYVEVDTDGAGWSLGGENNDADSISKGMSLAPACEQEVAAKKKKKK